jgi:hypothetical protein
MCTLPTAKQDCVPHLEFLEDAEPPEPGVAMATGQGRGGGGRAEEGDDREGPHMNTLPPTLQRLLVQARTHSR